MGDLRAIIFVPALAGSVICGFVFALFASHAYLTVLQNTGSGARRIGWQSEPILDHFWKVFYLAWLIGLWLGPAFFVARAVAVGSDLWWVKLAVPLAVFWVCYPISQLSSLSASTIWVPLHPDVFARLAQKPGVFLGFMLLSAPVLALLGVGFHWTFFADGLHGLAFGCPLLVTAGLLYGRLLGRLAYALMYTRDLFRRRKKKKKQDDAEDEKKAHTPARPTEEEAEEDPGFTQPRDLPPIHTPDEGPLTGYDLKVDEPPKKPRKRVVAQVAEEDEPAKAIDVAPPQPKKRRRPADDDDDDLVAFGMQEAEATPEDHAPKNVIKPSADEMKLLERDDAPKPPKQVWSAELLAFLGEPETITMIVLLSVFCATAGGMVRIARAFNPAD